MKNQSLKEHLTSLGSNLKKDDFIMRVEADIIALAKEGIKTIEDFKHDEARTTHYDLYKEVYNIKPRWYNYENMTAEEIEAENKVLYTQLEQQIVRRKEEKEAESRMIQERKKRNYYKPNFAFSDLKSLIEK